MGKNIGIYFAFGVGSAALVVVQTLILWIFCSIEVRSKLLSTLRYTRLIRLTGQSQTARADGVRHLPLSNELFRNHTCRTHPQPILQVRGSNPKVIYATLIMHLLRAGFAVDLLPFLMCAAAD